MDKQRNKHQLGRVTFVSILLLIVLVCSVIIADDLIYPDTPDDPYERKTVVFDGVSYFPRQDVRVFLLMGIDREGPVVDSGSYKNSGAADVVMVFVFDDANKEYRILALNRDSMVEMPVLGLGGKQAGTVTAQLALAHTYGNGLRQSCVNTRNTVSDLLFGVTIHQYISMNMDVISILTDAVGGVKVTVTDDFSEIDSTIVKGELVLNGEQAYKFLRTRKDLGDQLNLSRMDRHKEFMAGFAEAYRTSVGKDASKAMELYEEVSPYIVTDCSKQVMADILNRFYDYDLVEILSPAGSNVAGEEYMEFYIDEDNLGQLILSLLYTPKKN